MKILVISLLILSVNSFAREPKIFTTFVYAQGGESIDSLLFDTYKLPVEVLFDRNYTANVKRWNWFVQNPDKLLPGERVYIELPYRYKVYFENNQRMISSVSKIIKVPIVKKKKEGPKLNADYLPASKDLNLSVLFTSSTGTFTDVNEKSMVKGSSTQDSPITLGFAATIKSNVQRLSYSTSFYASYLVGVAQDQTNDLEVPIELGSNFYWNYNYKDLQNIYLGFDIERFSSFNIETLQNGDDFFTKEHSILYATFGYFNYFYVFGKDFFFKSGISQSLVSQTNIESSVDNSPYNGLRGIAFISTKLSTNVSTHFLAKQHLLTGPSELSITRFGIGLSYQYF